MCLLPQRATYPFTFAVLVDSTSFDEPPVRPSTRHTGNSSFRMKLFATGLVLALAATEAVASSNWFSRAGMC